MKMNKILLTLVVLSIWASSFAHASTIECSRQNKRGTLIASWDYDKSEKTAVMTYDVKNRNIGTEYKAKLITVYDYLEKIQFTPIKKDDQHEAYDYGYGRDLGAPLRKVFRSIGKHGYQIFGVNCRVNDEEN